MKRIVRPFAMLIVLLLCIAAACTVRRDTSAPITVTGFLDHVVVTPPTAQFNALGSFVSSRFPDSWKPQRDPGKSEDVKAFIYTGEGNVYVEVWNAGLWPYFGYQIGLSSSDAH